MLQSYSGDQPYIFISYSHIDRDIAFEIISEMQSHGYRVWFDEGIDPGTEWDENIASHIDNCGFFIALISQNYLRSENCKDELNYVRDQKITRLLVYLENVALPNGMQMRHNRVQAIHKYTYSTNEAFFQKLEKASGICDFRDVDTAAIETGSSDSNPSFQHSSPSQYLSGSVRNFIKACDISPGDRGEFAVRLLELYRKQYAYEIAAGTMTVRNLIYPVQWIQPKDSDTFMLLNDVSVDTSFTGWNTPPPRSSYLPYAREGYAINRKTILTDSLMFNGPLFALESFSGTVGDHNLTLTVKKSGYFDFLDTCEYLTYEVSYLHKIKRKKLPQKLSRFCGLPLRAKQKELLDLDNRFAGIGINNATILYNVEVADRHGQVTKESFLLLNRLWRKTTLLFGGINVIPACSYQPMGMELSSSFNLDMSNTVYRELGEELLFFDALTFLDDDLTLEEKYRRWPVFLLGMGFEPLNTKIEVMTAMQLDMDDQENRDLFDGNYTLEGLKQFFHTIYEGNLLMVPITEHDLRQCYHNAQITPVTKEILVIILEHMDFFKSKFIPS